MAFGHQVGHVRQCAIWTNVLICDKFLRQRALLINMGSKFVVFQLILRLPFSIFQQFVGTMKPERPERRKKGSSKFQGGPGHPVVQHA